MAMKVDNEVEWCCQLFVEMLSMIAVRETKCECGSITAVLYSLVTYVMARKGSLVARSRTNTRFIYILFQISLLAIVGKF